MDFVFKNLFREIFYLIFLTASIVLCAYLAGGVITNIHLFLITLEGILILWGMHFFPIAKNYDFYRSFKKVVIGPLMSFLVGFPIIMVVSYFAKYKLSFPIINIPFIVGLVLFTSLLLDRYRHSNG